MWIAVSQLEQLTEREPAIEVIHDSCVFPVMAVPPLPAALTELLPLSGGGPAALASIWWANQHVDFSFKIVRLLANQESQISKATPPLDVGFRELSRDFGHFSSGLHSSSSSCEVALVPLAHRDPHPAKHVTFFAAVLLLIFIRPTGNFR